MRVDGVVRGVGWVVGGGGGRVVVVVVVGGSGIVVVGVGVDVVVSCCAWNAVSLAANDAPKAPHADALGGVVGSAGVVVGGSACVGSVVESGTVVSLGTLNGGWLGSALTWMFERPLSPSEREMPAAVKTTTRQLHTVSNI